MTLIEGLLPGVLYFKTPPKQYFVVNGIFEKDGNINI